MLLVIGARLIRMDPPVRKGPGRLTRRTSRRFRLRAFLARCHERLQSFDSCVENTFSLARFLPFLRYNYVNRVENFPKLALFRSNEDAPRSLVFFFHCLSVQRPAFAPDISRIDAEHPLPDGNQPKETPTLIRSKFRTEQMHYGNAIQSWPPTLTEARPHDRESYMAALLWSTYQNKRNAADLDDGSIEARSYLHTFDPRGTGGRGNEPGRIYRNRRADHFAIRVVDHPSLVRGEANSTLYIN